MIIEEKDPDLIEQERIDNQKLKIRFRSDKNIKTLFNILFVCFRQDYTIPSTTIDANTGIIQCENSRRRSLEDIYLVSKYYIPNISYKLIKNISLLLRRSGFIYFGYCSNVGREVHRSFSIQKFDKFVEYLNSNGIEDILIDETKQKEKFFRHFNEFDTKQTFYNVWGGLKFEDNVKIKTLADVIWFACISQHLTISEKTGKIQKLPNRIRHENEIYRIAKYYFPEITFIRVKETLEELVNIDKVLYRYFTSRGLCMYSNSYQLKFNLESFNLMLKDSALEYPLP